MKLSNYEIDNERIGVSESAVEFSKENSEIKVAHSQPLSLTKESILGNKEHIESVVKTCTKYFKKYLNIHSNDLICL
jgi:hypothetical protein